MVQSSEQAGKVVVTLVAVVLRHGRPQHLGQHVDRARARDDVGDDGRDGVASLVTLGLDDDAALDRTAAEDAVLDNVDVDGVLAERRLDVMQVRADASASPLGMSHAHVGLAVAVRQRSVGRRRGRAAVRRVRVLEGQQAGEAELLHVLGLGLDQAGGGEVVVDVDLLLDDRRVVDVVGVQLRASGRGQARQAHSDTRQHVCRRQRSPNA